MYDEVRRTYIRVRGGESEPVVSRQSEPKQGVCTEDQRPLSFTKNQKLFEVYSRLELGLPFIHSVKRKKKSEVGRFNEGNFHRINSLYSRSASNTPLPSRTDFRCLKNEKHEMKCRRCIVPYLGIPRSWMIRIDSSWDWNRTKGTVRDMVPLSVVAHIHSVLHCRSRSSTSTPSWRTLESICRSSEKKESWRNKANREEWKAEAAYLCFLFQFDDDDDTERIRMKIETDKKERTRKVGSND